MEYAKFTGFRVAIRFFALFSHFYDENLASAAFLIKGETSVQDHSRGSHVISHEAAKRVNISWISVIPTEFLVLKRKRDFVVARVDCLNKFIKVCAGQLCYRGAVRWSKIALAKDDFVLE